MDKYIIKASGNITQVIAALKALKTIYGDGATLSTVATATRYIRLNQALKNQFDGGKI